jgi:Cu(I)/Ag(I) efflux system membrane fusion protein/cobalt-zinc-cadmium efflux system membrane fusion protein
MRQIIVFAAIVAAMAFFSACGSDTTDRQNHMPNSESLEMGEKDMPMTGHNEWIRSEPIDVKALDVDDDGYVYQDQMDWNVIADEEGKCPLCGMILKKVPLEEAVKNLKDNGYKVQ